MLSNRVFQFSNLSVSHPCRLNSKLNSKLRGRLCTMWMKICMKSVSLSLSFRNSALLPAGLKNKLKLCCLTWTHLRCLTVFSTAWLTDILNWRQLPLSLSGWIQRNWISSAAAPLVLSSLRLWGSGYQCLPGLGFRCTTRIILSSQTWDYDSHDSCFKVT